MEHAARGKKALDAKQYDEAIDCYTSALKVSPTSPDYLIQRSAAHQRKQEYGLALADAEQAVLAAQRRAKRESIIEAQFRRGCALLSLERYADAELVLNVVLKMNEKHAMAHAYAHRTKNAMAKLAEDDERRKVIVKEMPDGELQAGGAGEEAGQKAGTAASAGTTDGGSTNGSSATRPPAAPQQTPADKIRHEWYQSNDNIYFTLLAKGVPKDKAQVDIQSRSLNISFPLTTGSSYDLTLEPLFADVKPEKCIIRVMATKVEVILVKATPGQKWPSLEGSEPVAADATEAGASESDGVKRAMAASTTGPAYPTSSKSGPKDWDAIARGSKSTDKDGNTPIEDDDDYEGGDEANHFFKKLFKGASPEAQRAMMKSYTESNGTALSTDWNEVSKGKVETVPPDGMEAKEWSK